MKEALILATTWLYYVANICMHCSQLLGQWGRSTEMISQLRYGSYKETLQDVV